MVHKRTVRGYSTDAVRHFGLCPVRDSFSAYRNCIERANCQFRYLYRQVNRTAVEADSANRHQNLHLANFQREGEAHFFDADFTV